MLEVNLEQTADGDAVVFGYLLTCPNTLLRLCSEYTGGFFAEQQALAKRRSSVALQDAQAAARQQVEELEKRLTELGNQVHTLTTELKHKDEGLSPRTPCPRYAPPPTLAPSHLAQH